MIQGIPKISVLIICYKQEELIKRAINSLLAQKDYIYEICVSDDCSPDRTWEVLQEYDRQYPGLFKLNRNNPNVGIFENEEKTYEMPTGDIIYKLAGDDACGYGWFKKVIEFIQAKGIDYKNELFCIYGDYLTVYPNGDSIREKNNLISKGYDPLKLALRGLISNRSSCFSINVLRKYIKVSQGRSHIVEDAQDRQLQMFTKKNYYIPYVGNLYYSAIGVSSNILSSEEQYKERLAIKPFFFEFAKKNGFSISKSDLRYGAYNIAQKKFSRCKSIKKLIVLIIRKVKSIDLKYGLKDLHLKHFAFAVLRRLPHFKPINM